MPHRQIFQFLERFVVAVGEDTRLIFTTGESALPKPTEAGTFPFARLSVKPPGRPSYHVIFWQTITLECETIFATISDDASRRYILTRTIDGTSEQPDGDSFISDVIARSGIMPTEASA